MNKHHSIQPAGRFSSTVETKRNGHPLPKGWQWVKIGDIAEVSTGGTPSTSHPEYYGGDIRWLKSGDVKGTYIDEVPNRITQLGVDNSNARIHPAGSVMLAMSGQGKTRGTSAILRVPSTCSQSVAAILPLEHAIPEIIHYALVNRYEDTRRITGDDERTGLNLKLIREIEIPLPPLDEQRRIASRLNEGLAAVESARVAAEEQLQAARRLPSAYLREVFEGEEAKKWKAVRLGDVGEIVGGLQKTPDRAPTKFHKPYLTVRNVKQGYLDLSQVERFEVTPNEFERCRLHIGDLLIVEGNGSIDQIGRNALFELDGDDWIHQNHVIRVRLPQDRFSPKFAGLFLNSPLGRAQMVEKAMTTSGLYTLSSGKVASLETPSPALEVQQRTVQELDAILVDVNNLQSGLGSQLAEINRLPASLLREAFSRFGILDFRGGRSIAEKKSTTKVKSAQKTTKPTTISVDARWRMYDLLVAEHRHLHDVWMDNFRVILTFNSILLPGALGVYALIFKGNVIIGGKTYEVPMWPLVVLCIIGTITTVVMMMIIRRVGAFTELRQRELRRIELDMLQDLPIHPFLEGYVFGGGSISNVEIEWETKKIRNKWFNSQIGYTFISLGFVIAYLLIGTISLVIWFS